MSNTNNTNDDSKKVLKPLTIPKQPLKLMVPRINTAGPTLNENAPLTTGASTTESESKLSVKAAPYIPKNRRTDLGTETTTSSKPENKENLNTSTISTSTITPSTNTTTNTSRISLSGGNIPTGTNYPQSKKIFLTN
jgi:hypothetical protein